MSQTITTVTRFSFCNGMGEKPPYRGVSLPLFGFGFGFPAVSVSQPGLESRRALRRSERRIAK